MHVRCRGAFSSRPRRAVVVHPQSIVHCMVEYVDGSVLAQLGTPDMRTPIACALAWPERIDSGGGPLDLASLLGVSEPRRLVGTAIRYGAAHWRVG